jgi:uncharacterized protein (DUF362 family)
MSHPISRRAFLATGAAAGAAAIMRTMPLFPAAAHPGPIADTPDLAMVTGPNAYDATTRAVDLLGGMRRFVRPGDRVALLVNNVFDRPGSYVKPQIALAVAVMCTEAGASRIIGLNRDMLPYLRRATLTPEHDEIVRAIQRPGGTTHSAITGARRLKEAGVLRDYLEADVLINIPIFKDHEGCRMTGVMKNVMGATDQTTNRFFHFGSDADGWYDDPIHLAECIADAALLRRPSLCVGDGTAVLATNGPAGPGRVITPNTVVAGTDPVAVDAAGASLLGLALDEVPTIGRAATLGIGTSDLSTLHVERARL